MAVDEAGDHRAAVRVDHSVGRRGLPSQGRSRPPDRRRRSAPHPRTSPSGEPSPSAAVVGDQLADAVTSRLIATPPRCRQRRATSTTRRCLPSRTISRPSTMTCVTSEAKPAKRTPQPGVGSNPAVRTVSRRTVTRSARAPGAMTPASVQPRACVPGLVAAVSSSSTAKWPRRSSRSRSLSLDGPGLLEEVDDGVAVAAEGQRRSGVLQGPGRADAVAQIALRGGAEADVMSCRRGGYGRRGERCVAWTAVTLVQHARRSEELGRACSREARGTPRSRPAVRRGARGSAPRTVGERAASASGGTARTECTAAPICSCRRRAGDALGPRVDVAVAEPLLSAVQRRAVDRGLQVKGVDQRDPDARPRPRPRSAGGPSRSGRRTAAPPGP